MNGKAKKDPSEFEAAFVDWGRRPPPTSPEAAGRRLRERLVPAVRDGSRWRVAVAAAVLVAITSLVWVAVWQGNEVALVQPTPVAGRPSGDFGPPPLDDNVVLWWLDADTPVYFVINTPDP